MDEHEKRRLDLGGALVPLGDRTAVRVTLQVADRLPMSDVHELQAKLSARFKHVAQHLSDRGGVVDLESVSALSQSADACIPLDEYEDIRASLETRDHLKVEPILERQVLGGDE